MFLRHLAVSIQISVRIRNIWPTYRTILVMPIIQIPTTLVSIFPRSFTEVIDREEHESGFHLTLRRPLRTVREASSLRVSKNCFDAIFANDDSQATASRCWRRP